MQSAMVRVALWTSRLVEQIAERNDSRIGSGMDWFAERDDSRMQLVEWVQEWIGSGMDLFRRTQR